MQSQKVALNYFQSSEFWNTFQLLGVMSIPYILQILIVALLNTVVEASFA